VCSGVNDNRIIKDPIKPPVNNLQICIGLFKKMAVKYRRRVSNNRLRAHIISK
jgi:hypothetical protein